MPSFFSGDELGSIKYTSYSKTEEGWKATTSILYNEPGASSKARSIQKLTAFKQGEDDILLAAARADGSASVLSITDESSSVVSEWKETRLREGQRYVGLASSSSGIFTCTSNGALRLTKPGDDLTLETAVLPMRLSEWRLSPDEKTFAYAGDEVELSIWDSERAFTAKQLDAQENNSSNEASKKRKRVDQLLPGELWRAKNLPNDNLNLRQPVRNNCLTYLQPSNQPQLLVGTQFGDVRRYDTRTARRPVSNWKGIAKVGGIGVVEKGLAEHEVFVADHGCNLFSLDLRNGKIAYGYKGIAGAITSVAPAPNFLASVGQDRFIRLHSTFPLPKEAGQQQEHKGDILDKAYAKVVPTVIVIDPRNSVLEDEEVAGGDEEEEEDIWEEMEDAESDVEGKGRGVSKKRKSD
ncbi:hypothetical protein QCA50_003186 [Cerrena zonata]|uniref:Ribosome biogenesis protein NSA1 n=1 Tax=Cerrena zonata TaxID=2478898 RepID=A0AAW0GNZ4_9APHY